MHRELSEIPGAFLSNDGYICSGQSYAANVDIFIRITTNLISDRRTQAVRPRQPEHLQFPGSEGGHSG
jgi:hypothetical protein